jgi:hypothetical protein
MTKLPSGRFFLFFGETGSFLPLHPLIRAFPIDPENLWHNRRSFRVMPRIKRQTHQWNGAGPSDSDSSRRRSFTRAGTYRWRQPVLLQRARVRRLQVCRSGAFRFHPIVDYSQRGSAQSKRSNRDIAR